MFRLRRVLAGAVIALVLVGAHVAVSDVAVAHPYGDNHGGAAIPTYLGYATTNSIGSRAFIVLPADALINTECGARHSANSICRMLPGGNTRPMQIVASSPASAASNGYFVATGVDAGCHGPSCSPTNGNFTQYADGYCTAGSFDAQYFWLRDPTQLTDGAQYGLTIERSIGSSSWSIQRNGSHRMSRTCDIAFTGFPVSGNELRLDYRDWALNLDFNLWGMERKLSSDGHWTAWADGGDKGVYNDSPHSPTMGLWVHYGTFLGTTIEGYGSL